MEKKLAAAAERYLNSLRQNKRRTQMLRCVAVLVVLATISALVMPALTMSNEVECGLTEHIHTESCWSEQLALPEPELTCTAGVSGEVVVHTHDEYCWDSQGNLICNLPETEAHVHSAECYQEHRTLTCEQTAEPGHQHDASCYAYVRAESPAAEHAVVYTCGMQEGEGAHQHMEECYPQERVAEPLCGLEETGDEYDGEGNLIQQGHRHTDECWLVRVHEKLVCGLEETENEYDEEGNLVREGHAHSASCWLTGNELCLRYGCGQQERAGHVHTDACTQGSVQVDSQGEQWEQVLVCGEQEREPGHVHTDECYEITQMLTCRRQELTAHTHNAGCCDEDGALICGLTEVLVHQHTDACFATPEGGPEPARVLVCGKEEHTHTDLCYVKVLPEEERETFYCGQEEHVHSLEECYFPSGGLKCTLGEHVHDMTCMIPPAEESDDPLESGDPLESDDPQQSQGPEEPGQGDDSQIWVDESYVHETEAFRIIFQVTGWAKPAEDGQEAGAAENELWISDFAPEVVSTPSYEEGLVELVSQRIPLAALPMGFSASLDPDALPGADPFAENNRSEADTGPAGPVGSVVEDNRPAPSNEPVQIAPQEEDEPVVIPTPEITPSFTPIPEISPEPVPTPEAAERLELVVEQLADTDPEYQRAAVNAQLELGEEESTVVDVLRIALYAGNQKMDLSGCEVTAVVEATQELKDAMEAQEAMTADEDGPLPGEDAENQEEEEPTFAMTDEQGVVAFAKVSEPMVVTLSNEIMALSAVASQANPRFTVQYYAYLDTANLSETGKTGKQPEVLDTPGGVLPTNTTAGTHIKYLELNKDKTVKTSNHVQPIYRTHIFNYLKAPGIQYFNIVTNNLQNDENGNQILSNYTLDEVWLPIAEGETVDTAHGWSEVPREDLPAGETGRWQKITWNDRLHFTNRPKTAADDPDHYILIEEEDLIRLVYNTKTGHKDYPSNFYDYDITDGKRYDDSGKEATGGTYLKTQGETPGQGINSGSNYGTGQKLAFGNNNTGTGLGDQASNDYYINRANKNVFRFCSFGLVKEMNADGGLIYKDGIAAPNLFGGGTMPTGRSDYKGSLKFLQDGDTYTLTSAAVGGGGSSDLHMLKYDRENWDKTLHMFSNDFWPMDAVESAGAAGHDPLLGQGQYTMADDPLKQKDPTSDYPNGDGVVKNLHNPYFGMKYAVEFTLTEDYVGPLEYIFFGDDDMWVFLTNTETEESKLICDIGGVHNSVGEYVDLWDHVKKDGYERNPRPLDTTNQQEGETYSARSTKYRLTFFYTERGASGSTCWMQFTLPTAVGVDLEDIIETKVDENHGALILEKKTNIDTLEKFKFTLKFEGITDYHEVEITRLNSSGEWEIVTELLEEGESTWYLGKDEKLVITNLPKGVTYTITEAEAKGYEPSYTVENKYHGEEDERPKDFPENVPSTPGNTVTGTIQGLSSVTVTFTNNSSYELPSTGGAGTWYTMAGVPLAALLCLMYKKKSKGEGDGG